MNLNSLKRGFTKTNPDKGLSDLPGANKTGRSAYARGVVRIKGRYVSENYGKLAQVLGSIAYVLSWASSGVILLVPFFSEDVWGNWLLSGYAVLGFLLHILVMIADGVGNSNEPKVRKSIKVFWSGLALFLAVSILLEVIGLL